MPNGHENYYKQSQRTDCIVEKIPRKILTQIFRRFSLIAAEKFTFPQNVTDGKKQTDLHTNR